MPIYVYPVHSLYFGMQCVCVLVGERDLHKVCSTQAVHRLYTRSVCFTQTTQRCVLRRLHRLLATFTQSVCVLRRLRKGVSSIY